MKIEINNGDLLNIESHKNTDHYIVEIQTDEFGLDKIVGKSIITGEKIIITYAKKADRNLFDLNFLK